MKTYAAATALGLLIITSAPAHAYIDAGSGSYMLQLSLAGLMAVAFTVKSYLHKIREFAARIGGPKSTVTSGE
jgi:hypothetical protein